MNRVDRPGSGLGAAWGRLATARKRMLRLMIACLGVAPLLLQAQPPERLKYLGRFESRNLINEFQDVAVVGESGRYLAVASVTGLTIVEREAVKTGIVVNPLQRYRIDRLNERSNLDGASTAPKWAPKFYEIADFGSFLYVATRFDGLWIFTLASNGAVNEIGRLLRPREFTESVKILDNRMFLTHHADGIEVLDLADPGRPRTLATLSQGFVDAWGIAPEADGSVWVADGAGGLKLAHWNGTQLTHIAGETVQTSPGVVQDVALAGDWVVGALAGQGVAVYDEATAARVGTFPLQGVCVDLEPINDQRLAVSCTNWVHVIELDAAGTASIVASTRLNRRTDPNSTLTFIPSHQSYRLAWDGEVLYVAGWHYADAYQLVADDPDDDPEIWISGQRAHFGVDPAISPEVLSFRIENGGEGALDISRVVCPAALVCSIGSTLLQPGDSTELTLSYDGTSPNLQTQVDILSNDPDDGMVRITVFTPGSDRVDPQEVAPDFTGLLVRYDYETQTFSETAVSLFDYMDAGQAVHFGFFGGFCPACAWKGASVAADITARLPQGAMNFLVEVASAQGPVEHMMEKIRIPVDFVFSNAAESLYKQPDNKGSQGLPAFRDYVVDPAGIVTTVLAQEYSPDKVLDALEDAVGNGGPVPDAADLSVSKSDAPDPVQVGQNLTYTLQIRNNGPDGASNVVLTDTLPASVIFVSANPSQGICVPAGGAVTCELATIADGGLATVALLVTPTVAGTINNAASVSAAQTDPDPGNNTASQSTTVEASTSGTADLAVTKSDDPDPVQLGQSLTYTVQTRNNGPDSATNVVLTDILPDSASFVSATSSQGGCTRDSGLVTCNLGTLVNGGLATVTVLITPTATGTINNAVGVAATETDPNPANNAAAESTLVEALPSGPLEIIDVSPDVLAPGDVAQLTVTGTGFQPGADVVVCRTGGVSITNIQVVDANTILVDVTVAPDRPPGICGVRVINPDGERDTLVPAFSIQ